MILIWSGVKIGTTCQWNIKRFEVLDDTRVLFLDYVALDLLITCGSVILIQTDNTYPDWNTMIIGSIPNMDTKNDGSEKATPLKYTYFGYPG